MPERGTVAVELAADMPDSLVFKKTVVYQYLLNNTCCPLAMGCDQRRFKLVTVSQVLNKVPSKWPIASSATSVACAGNDKGEDEVKPGAVHRSPGSYFRV